MDTRKVMMKILVIGDTCKDVFVYGSCDRICPEAPVPVFLPKKTITNDGMTGNVVNNVRALGYNCDAIVNNGRIKKTRYIDFKTNQMIMRVDKNDYVERSYERNAKKLMGYDVIIISDYGKGFLSEEDIAFISKSAGCPTFMQTNKIISEWCLGVDFIKINEMEYKRTMHLLDTIGDDIQNKLIVTLGSRGSRFRGKIYPVKDEVKVKSLAGAGDTFLAALAVEYIETYGDIYRALDFAQKCASKVVQEPGVVSL
jgi:D-beta-D-heptose 7-phosphate kinase/D-beta-D-heptose 1-phosphate adenosyltransferase